MRNRAPLDPIYVFLVIAMFLAAGPVFGAEQAVAQPESAVPFWVWPAGLFAFTFVLGILAVLAGVGGGVLYVPLVSAFFPFHLDFVRGAGLFVALSCSVAAGPRLLRANLANLRLALPFALVASAFSVVGALLGLALPASVVQMCLGLLILFVAGLMLFSRDVVRPVVEQQDSLSMLLGISGAYREPSDGDTVHWKTRRTLLGFFTFAGIGLAGGMFGLGAGWANVPALNLLLGAPLKVAVGSSVFLISITGSSAAWIYMNKGCLIPLIAIPSIIGLMLGAKVGVKIFSRTHPTMIRYIVLTVLTFAGLKALLKGLGWG